MAATKIAFKRGDTFTLACAVEDDAGDPMSISGWTIAAQVRTQLGVLVAGLTVGSRNDAAGTYRLTASSTTAWPVEPLHLDVQYTDAAGVIVSTDDVLIAMQRDATIPS